MRPHLAQVLNTLAHEIRTPLAVSQGYLKLFLDGRFANEDDTRKAMEQTRQALGALATYCVDMGKISALSERAGGAGVPERVEAADLIDRLRSHADLAGVDWEASQAGGAIEGRPLTDLVEAVAIVLKAGFDEARGDPREVSVGVNQGLTLLTSPMRGAVSDGTQPEPVTEPVNFGKGGKGLKLIWAAFVLDAHGVDTWTLQNHKASVGIRIPLVTA